MQVVDLLEELILRGLDPQLAAALLDSGALALGLSVWAAAPDSCSSSSNASAVAHSMPSRIVHNSYAANRVSSFQQPQQQQRHSVDGAGCAALRVALLLDDGQVPLRSFQTFVRRDSSHHFVSRKLSVAPGRWNR